MFEETLRKLQRLQGAQVAVSVPADADPQHRASCWSSRLEAASTTFAPGPSGTTESRRHETTATDQTTLQHRPRLEFLASSKPTSREINGYLAKRCENFASAFVSSLRRCLICQAESLPSTSSQLHLSGALARKRRRAPRYLKR
jgi:hypothetical protein